MLKSKNLDGRTGGRSRTKPETGKSVVAHTMMWSAAALTTPHTASYDTPTTHTVPYLSIHAESPAVRTTVRFDGRRAVGVRHAHAQLGRKGKLQAVKDGHQRRTGTQHEIMHGGSRVIHWCTAWCVRTAYCAVPRLYHYIVLQVVLQPYRFVYFGSRFPFLLFYG